MPLKPWHPSAVCHAALLALLVSAVLPAPSGADFSPTTPTFALKWGSTGSGLGQFSSPLFLSTDHQGNVYVSDQDNNRIQKFDFLGNFIMQWGTGGSGNGQFNVPRGVAFDAAGNVYV